jgi:hypothetical protein
MSNLYSTLTAKIIEKNSATSETINNIKNEIKFIAEQLRKEQSIEYEIDSAFCYYIAGYYVQAMYLAQRIQLNKIDSLQRWLLLFIKKDFEILEKSVNKILSNQEFTDQHIKNKIETEGLSDIEAVNMVVTFKVAEVLAVVLHFIKTGNENRILSSLKMLETCQNLACKSGEWIIWWRLECLGMVVKEFVECSLWTQLKTFSTDKQSTEIVEKYIISNYGTRKIVELWRSQTESLPKINDADRCSFCISVPTSGGKTTVAELTVLRFLLDYIDQPDTKCVYIAPFRKLALEVESALSKAFELINGRLVSTFYGGREIDIFEARDIERARVLIVTPEKLDALLRQHHNLLSQIRLVIADEGHMIGEKGNRSYTYRLLLERLIYKLYLLRATDVQKPRIVLISGVLPNIEDFADLISGDRNNIIKVNWRPLGEPEISTWHWTGKELRLYHPKIDIAKSPTPFPCECSSQDKFEEITAKTAVSYALTRPTMVFSASAKSIYNDSLLDLLECIGEKVSFHPKPLARDTPKVQGFEKYYFLLERGIAIHHKNLPRALKKEIESRIDNNQVQLLFTSPTLGQGVNIPFEIIIIYKLQHYSGNPITPSAFWNVVGRAGRPIIKSNNLDAPEILFFLNLASNSKHQDQLDAQISKELLQNRAKYQVVSPFLDFLLIIQRKWKEITTKPIAELVSNLSEKKGLRDIVGDLVYLQLKTNEDTLSVDVLLRMFDEHINTIIKENDITDNLISEWLQKSSSDLANLFVKATNIDAKDLEYIKYAILARISFNAQFVSGTDRDRDYLLGLPIQDCELIKQNEDLLLSWYKASEGIFSDEIDSGLDNFVRILSFVADLTICKGWHIRKKSIKSNQLSLGLIVPDKNSIIQTALLRKWLDGREIENLLSYVKQLFPYKEFDEYREDILESNMAWGMSAICRYLNTVAEHKGLSLTKDLDFLSSFVKYGVNTKIACQLIKFGIPRVDAAKISTAYKEKLRLAEVHAEEIPEIESDFEEAIKSFSMFTDKELKALVISRETIKQFSRVREKYKRQITDLELDPPSFEFEPIDIE